MSNKLRRGEKPRAKYFLYRVIGVCAYDGMCFAEIELAEPLWKDTAQEADELKPEVQKRFIRAGRNAVQAQFVPMAFYVSNNPVNTWLSISQKRYDLMQSLPDACVTKYGEVKKEWYENNVQLWNGRG